LGVVIFNNGTILVLLLKENNLFSQTPINQFKINSELQIKSCAIWPQLFILNTSDLWCFLSVFAIFMLT